MKVFQILSGIIVLTLEGGGLLISPPKTDTYKREDIQLNVPEIFVFLYSEGDETPSHQRKASEVQLYDNCTYQLTT